MTSRESDIPKFGIQLWSVKDEMAKDPIGTLRSIASFGYNQVETFEGDNGMFWGMKTIEFKSFIEDLGMELVGGHCDVFANIEMKIDQANEAGLQFMVCPWLGPKDNLNDYLKAAEAFEAIGQKCKKQGIKFCYHNHDYSFTPINSIHPQEIFLNHTDPDHVFFEMDVYWTHLSGHDPISWIDKYQNRWPILHIKDQAELYLDDKFISTELGKGIIDYAALLEAFQVRGIKYFMVEQERFDHNTPLDAAKVNAEYMVQVLKKIAGASNGSNRSA